VVSIAGPIIVATLERSLFKFMMAPPLANPWHSLNPIIVDCVIIAVPMPAIEVLACTHKLIHRILRRINAKHSLNDPDRCLALEHASVDLIHGELFDLPLWVYRIGQERRNVAFVLR
jgi:hypothetical protein